VHRASLGADEGADLRLNGQVDLAARMYAQADSLYARAERLDSDWSGPTVQRGWLALERAALTGNEITAKDPGSLRSGIGHAERALDEAPDDVAALELRGALLSALSWVSDSAGELRAAAIEDLERAVSQEPDRARAWADLSDLYRREGRYVDAQKASARAWEADAFLANEPEYLRQSAHVALEVGEFAEALDLVRSGRERVSEALWPDAIELLVMATAGAPAFDPDSAWTVLSRMERLQGEEAPMGRMQVSAVLARAGLGDSARAVLARALEIVPDRARVFAMPYRANVHLHLGEPSRTLDLLERYLEAVPSEREYVSRDVWWEPIRDDSAFQALVSAEN
jgi:tetratricopeptide (TPR) repeat protein